MYLADPQTQWPNSQANSTAAHISVSCVTQ